MAVEIPSGIALGLIKAAYQIVNPKKNTLISVRDQDLLADIDTLLDRLKEPHHIDPRYVTKMSVWDKIERDVWRLKNYGLPVSKWMDDWESNEFNDNQEAGGYMKELPEGKIWVWRSNEFVGRKSQELYDIRDKVEYESLGLERKVRKWLLCIVIPLLSLVGLGLFYLYVLIETGMMYIYTLLGVDVCYESRKDLHCPRVMS